MVDTGPVYAIDYNRSGRFFASAGKDKSVRVYDEARKTLLQEMRGNDSVLSLKSSHSSRM